VLFLLVAVKRNGGVRLTLLTRYVNLSVFSSGAERSRILVEVDLKSSVEK